MARTCTDIAKGTNANIEKLAVASGASDYDQLDLTNAKTIFLQGEKYLLGFGCPVDYRLAYQRYKVNIFKLMLMIDCLRVWCSRGYSHDGHNA